MTRLITVPEAARRAGRNPETIRRWIRAGRLASTKVGTQHRIDERDLEAVLAHDAEILPLPPEWRLMSNGKPMVNVVEAVRRSRAGQRALERAAAIEGRSEAELIREGVDVVTARHRSKDPTLPLFRSEIPDLASRADELLEGSARGDPPGHERTPAGGFSGIGLC